MKRIVKVAALAVMVMGVAAMLQPANAICSSARLFSTPYYFITPGCESGCTPDSISITENAVGKFWAFGDGDPATGGAGIDNGSFEGFPGYPNGWFYIYPGYPVSARGTWAASDQIDGCIDFASDSQRCMALLLMDTHPMTGEGAFALATDEPDSLGNYDFAAADSDTTLATLAKLSIIASTRVGGGTGVDVTVDGVTLSSIQNALRLDPNCPDASALIQGYQIFEREEARNAPAPSDNNVDNWTPVGPVIPLNTPSTVSLSCSGDTDRYITAGIVFESNFQNVFLSGNSTTLHCGSTLADPDDIDIERKPPTNREKPRNRSRGR